MRFEGDIYPWLSIAMITWGVVDCFFGYRVFKLTIAVLGGFVGTIAGHTAGIALDLSGNGILALVVLGGLFGAGLAFLLYLAAVFLAGFLFGGVLGIMVLSHLNQMVAVLGGGVLGVACGFLSVKLQRPLITLSTALLGSFRAVLALSYFTNQIDWAFYYRQPAQIPALITGQPWMFPAILALSVIGVISQLDTRGGWNGRKRKDPE